MSKQQIFQIGRDVSCDIIIDDYSNRVSRSHATLRVEGRKYYITDHSSNGTYRNGIRLTPNLEYQVSTEDEISFGGVSYLDWNAITGTYANKSWPTMAVVLISVLATFIVVGLVWFFVARKDVLKHSFKQGEAVEQVDSLSKSDSGELKQPQTTEAETPDLKTEKFRPGRKERGTKTDKPVPGKRKSNASTKDKSENVKKNPTPVQSQPENDANSSNDILI